ncbi:hypothetical protein Tco_0267470 [Tanacetum coccineum]
MNPQETQQVDARDEKWVPYTERVKIISTNVRLETTMPQKEENFQVVIDIINNSTCFKAFTISAEVPEIFMQQFWYTIKKVKDSESYEFLVANKKCIVDAKVFRKILDIYPRVEDEEFTPVQDDDDTLTFLTDLGYKGPLYKHTNMFVDHMHQPWRTLAAIINKYLSGKTASNDKLRKSRINILLKFVKIGEDYQEYGVAIPDVMLDDTILQSESYQMFLKYSTGQIPPKKSMYGGRKVVPSSGVGEGKVDSIGGMGGGSLAIRSIVLNDGRGGGGFVIKGGSSPREGGEVNGGGVDLGVSKRLPLEVSEEMIGESGGIEVREVGGGADT